jgi:hypothetical protein
MLLTFVIPKFCSFLVLKWVMLGCTEDRAIGEWYWGGRKSLLRSKILYQKSYWLRTSKVKGRRLTYKDSFRKYTMSIGKVKWRNLHNEIIAVCWKNYVNHKNMSENVMGCSCYRWRYTQQPLTLRKRNIINYWPLVDINIIKTLSSNTTVNVITSQCTNVII